MDHRDEADATTPMTHPGRSLFEIFAAALPDGVEATTGTQQAELARRLDAMLEEAHAQWPRLEGSDADFVAFVAIRVRGAPLETLTRMHPPDLYLAYACSARIAGAVEAFDAQHGATLVELLCRRGVHPTTATEIKQQLYTRLFVGDGSTPPKIDTYGGRGRLSAWVRVAAVRDYLNLRRGRQREVGLDEAMLATVAGGSDDPELELLKSTYREEFKTAFAAAVAALSPRQRNLMRQHLIDGLSVDNLAALYHVHRTTVGRWLASAQERLFERTRQDLMKRLRLGRDEIESVMRLIRSRAELPPPGALFHDDGQEPGE
jgi:RNA polymerase sigma-70 factor (ECF subfamily)